MVNLINISIKQLMKNKTGKIYIFGASKRLKSYKNILPLYSLSEVADYIVDNDETKWGQNILLDNIMYTIISPQQMIDNISNQDKILIVSIHYEEIVNQLDSVSKLDGIGCYILDYIYAFNDGYIDIDYYEKCKGNKYYIPPVIHYCWFGGNPIPEEYVKYIATWKKKCPDYDILQWDESNYDVYKHPYIAKAYKDRKWAFVSDYARLDIIYNYGGIYLDTDVELLKGLDELRKFRVYFGFESETYISTGLGFGAEKGHRLIEKFLKSYDDIEPGTYIPCPQIQSKDMEDIGLIRNNTFQYFDDGGIAVLPSEFLCPMEYRYRQLNITEETVSIHHYSGSWLDNILISEGKDKIKNRILRN